MNEGQKQTTKGSFFYLPVSPVLDAIYIVLAAGGKPLRIIGHGHGNNHTLSVDLHIDKYREGLDRIRSIEVTRGNTKSIVKFWYGGDKTRFFTFKGMKKLWVYWLIKANEQFYSDGVVKKESIRFSLHDLVTIGCYSSIRAARKGLKDMWENMEMIAVKGGFKKRGRVVKQEGFLYLLGELDIYNSQAVFDMENLEQDSIDSLDDDDFKPPYGLKDENDFKANWEFIYAFYTILPMYYFRLSNKACDLLYLIFYIARQRTNQLKKQGYFTVSMENVRYRLCLPTYGKNLYRDVVQRIEKAIQEIKTIGNDNNLTITAVYNHAYKTHEPIDSFLKDAYLKITLRGEYLQYFCSLARGK